MVRCEYEVENSKPVLYLFQREGEKRILTKITDFIPYFYVPTTEVDNVKGLKIDSKSYYSVNGELVKRINTILPSDVPQLRDKFSRSFEADVLFSIRYQIDQVDTLDPVSPRTLFIDIETDNNGRVPDPSFSLEPVICVSIFCNEAYTSFIYRADFSPGKTSKISWDTLHEIIYFNREKDMLKAITKFIASEEPDIITGWNVSRFDLTYLINRMRKLGVDPNLLSPMRKVFIDDKENVVIKGLTVIDLYDLYRRFSENLEESYQLGVIGEKIVGIGKVDSASNVRFLWKQNPTGLIDYNLGDVRIVVELDKKLMLIDFLNEMRRLCFCNLEDCLTTSRMADSYILKMFHNKKVFPTKTRHERYEFEGAYVQSWAKGLYKNVVMFDLKSLYPSILYSANLSPETISENETKSSIKLNKIWVNQEVKGYLPQVIEILFQERAKYKDLMRQEIFDSDSYLKYELRQRAIKTLMNALYGQTAYPNSRIYDARIAETITWVGRNIILWSKKYIEELGYQVIYADTDSLAVVFDSIDLDQINTVLGLLNDSYDEFAKTLGITNHIFSMELDKIYRRAFYGSSKKRYVGAMVYKDRKSVDKLDVRGFEIRRSDASLLSRKLQETVFDMLLRQDKSKEEVLRCVGEYINRIRNGEYRFTEIGIPKAIKKSLSDYKNPGSNVRGAKYSTEILGYQLTTKPKMVYIKKMPEGLPPTDVLCFDEDSQIPSGAEIDVEKTLEKLIKDKLDSIFEALGWRINELVPWWRGKAPKIGVQEKLFEMT